MQRPLFLSQTLVVPATAQTADTAQRAKSAWEEQERQLTEREVYRVLMEEMSRLGDSSKSSAA